MNSPPTAPGPMDLDDDVDVLPTGARRCTATANSGNRCKAPAIAGGTVCRVHGGSTKQVKRSAKIRLALLAAPAIERLHELVESEDERVAQRAVDSILDRAGYPRGSTVSVDDARDLLRARLDEIRKQQTPSSPIDTEE